MTGVWLARLQVGRVVVLSSTLLSTVVGCSSGSVTAPQDASVEVEPNPFANLRWRALQAPLGCHMSAIAIDSRGVVFAGGHNPGVDHPSCGIFTSPDDGVSWQPVNNGVRDFNVAGLFADGSTLYAGTSALLRSVDHGASWTEVSSYRLSDGHMGVIGAQGDLVMAGSNDGGHDLVLSSDGGKTFKPVSGNAGVNDIVVLGSVILRSDDEGMLRSTDRGTTFAPIPGISNGRNLQANLRCDGVLTCYASAHDETNPGLPVIMKSTDAGATWFSTGKVGGRVVALSDTGIVYVSTMSTLARSDNGGATWIEAQRPTTVWLTTDGAFETNCSGPFAARGDKVFAACRDGVYRSDDRGQHWIAASGTRATGAITGRVSQFLVNNTKTALGADGDLYVVGETDTLLHRSSDGGRTWSAVGDYLTARTCIVTGGGSLLCIDPYGSPYGGSNAGWLLRSDDHGSSWTTIAVNAPNIPPSSQVTLSAIASQGTAVYAGGSRIARSDDDGRTFQPLAGGPTITALQVLSNGHVLASDIGNAVHRSIDRGATWQSLPRAFPLPVLEDTTGRLLLADYSGSVSISTDGGDRWQAVPDSGLPNSSSYGGPLGRDGSGRLFIKAPGPAIYASLNGGRTWSRLPNQPPNCNVLQFATDRKGRLLAATSGGLYRLEDSHATDVPTDKSPRDASDAPVAIPDTVPADAGTYDGPAGPRALSLVLADAPWDLNLSSTGLAVDSRHRVYRQQDHSIFVVDQGKASVYLTTQEAANQLGMGRVDAFKDLDMGPDDVLWVPLGGTLSPDDSTRTNAIIAHFSRDRVATRWQVIPGIGPDCLSVVAPGKAAYINYEGLWLVTHSSRRLVYSKSYPGYHPFGDISDAVVVNQSGVFLHHSVFTGAAMLRGNIDGSGVAILYEPMKAPIHGDRFYCTARDPAGGFYTLVNSLAVPRPRIYHIAEDASGATGLSIVHTDPSLAEVGRLQSQVDSRRVPPFLSCALATAPDGTIYLQTEKQLWRIAP